MSTSLDKSNEDVVRDEADRQLLQRGADALRRIVRRQARLWLDWTENVGRSVVRAREIAMAIAGTNRPEGRRYNEEMSRILIMYGMGVRDGLGETTRSH